ncbi:3'-5' exonuclease [Kitasatospora aburaviensis]|uniref:3'-5' exonuclease n=1 Tax=Kitasatospora aburaviensis TaxID=67265 RepID=A0ABW1F361_9ACTN
MTTTRVEPDPARVARSAPRDHVGGVPVFGWGQAPPYLRTQTQLAEDRLKLADGQPALAYIRTRKYGDVALYDPDASVRMRPLASSTKARMTSRRTCPSCQQVREAIVRGPQCSVCREQAGRAAARLRARTCAGCGTVRERAYPTEHGRCQSCRQDQLATKRARVAEWLVEVTTCVGDGCTVKLGALTRARAWLKDRPWLLRPDATSLPDKSYRPEAWSRRCPPCEAAEEQRRIEAQAWYEQRLREQAAAERRRAEERRAWAAAALLDPDVVVLDTETTGLHGEARIVEIAVLASDGQVLLDTLLNPGEPIPEESSAIHGITDTDVASAPAFADVLDRLTVLLAGKRCLIYNDVYDIGRLQHELTLHYLDLAARDADAPEERRLAVALEQAERWLAGVRFEDVMIPYSNWVGDYSEYHGGNRWQPLGGGHRAAGDCRAVLDCLRAMGRPTEYEALTGPGGWTTEAAS